MNNPVDKRHEFILFFDVQNGNPNGDPDAGNMPRLDAETNQGLVTDVCLKRKVRNYVNLVKSDPEGKPLPSFDIYVREGAILNNQHKLAYDDLGLDVPSMMKDKTAKKQADSKARKHAAALTAFMCRHFYDVRAFGAVMTTEINCGQVRGPVQFAFARSIDPIVPQEVSITRMAVTHERDQEKERTMGRKHIVPYGLYKAEGYVSAPLAQQTGFSKNDLELLWESLRNMFEHDRSAARGAMGTRKLIVFKHSSRLGNAPAHLLFESVTARRLDHAKPARAFSDYAVEIDHDAIPDTVTVMEKT